MRCTKTKSWIKGNTTDLHMSIILTKIIFARFRDITNATKSFKIPRKLFERLDYVELQKNNYSINGLDANFNQLSY